MSTAPPPRLGAFRTGRIPQLDYVRQPRWRQGGSFAPERICLKEYRNPTQATFGALMKNIEPVATHSNRIVTTIKHQYYNGK